MPKVSVIIPTYNGADYVCDTIDSALAQTYKDYEIIVVVDGSTDNTMDLLKKYDGKITCEYQENKGGSAARNKGIEISGGEFIAFLDHDDIADKDWLKYLIFGFKIDNVGISVGKVISLAPDTIIQKILALKDRDNINPPNMGYIKYFKTTNTMFKKELFIKLGKFDESLCPAEDIDFGIRINYSDFKAVFVSGAIVYYRHRHSFRHLMRQKYIYGYKGILLYKKHNLYKKNIFLNMGKFIFHLSYLFIRSLARAVKFILHRRERRFALLFQHPLDMACAISYYFGQFCARLRYDIWI